MQLRADEAGTLDLAKSASLGGSYEGIDALGMFWSMTATAAASAKDVDTREVRFELVRADGRTVSARIRLLSALDEVVTMSVDALPGARFASLPNGGPRPALIILGGSEGGATITDSAAPFASHGYAVLALPYFAPDRDIPGLPEGMVEQPIEYLEPHTAGLRDNLALTRLALRSTVLRLGRPMLCLAPCVSSGSMRLSRACLRMWSSMAGVLASPKARDLRFRGAASHCRSCQASATKRKWRRRRSMFAASMNAAVLPSPSVPPGLEFPSRNPGFADGDWRLRRPDVALRMMAQNLAERRLEAGLAVTARIYPDAGHFLYYTGYVPTTTYHQRAQKVGGSPAADARAQADAWQSTLRFLEQALH